MSDVDRPGPPAGDAYDWYRRGTALLESGDPAAAAFDGVLTRGNPLVWQADISRISRLGFTPAWTLARGLADLVEHWDADNAPTG